MEYNDKTKEQLIAELKALKDKLAMFEMLDDDHARITDALWNTQIQLQTLFHASDDFLFVFTHEGQILQVNLAMQTRLGYSASEYFNMNINDLYLPEQHNDFCSIINDLLMEEKSSACSHILICKDNTHIPVETKVNKTAWGDKEILFAISRDITMRRKTEEELRTYQDHLEVMVEQRTSELRKINKQLKQEIVERHQAEKALLDSRQKLVYIAYHDSLTDLYNRKAFMEMLEDSINNACHYNYKIAIFFIDIDKFKHVNDLYGHETGDKILRQVADRMKRLLRLTDYIFRLGGDEFTIILNNIDKQCPEAVAQRIIDNVSMQYHLDEKIIDFLGVSIGISSFPDDGDSMEILLRRADSAMYKAKNKGKSFIKWTDDLETHYD